MEIASEWCALCLAKGREHINQEDRSVYKHQHMDDSLCTRPWSALCQNEHGEVCYDSCYTSQPDALAALLSHLESGVHIVLGSGDAETHIKCARA